MSGLAIPVHSQASPPSPLGLSVLVLNRSFVAVHITNVRRAITLLFRQLAEVVHIEEGQYAAHSLESWRQLSALQASFRTPEQDWIRAVGYELQAPRVIRLVACDRGPRRSARPVIQATVSAWAGWMAKMRPAMRAALRWPAE